MTTKRSSKKRRELPYRVIQGPFTELLTFMVNRLERAPRHQNVDSSGESFFHEFRNAITYTRSTPFERIRPPCSCERPLEVAPKVQEHSFALPAVHFSD